jgi:hypothetical protein
MAQFRGARGDNRTDIAEDVIRDLAEILNENFEKWTQMRERHRRDHSGEGG